MPLPPLHPESAVAGEDGFVFMNIHNPAAAWGAYRGVIPCTAALADETGRHDILPFMTAFRANKPEWLIRETLLEAVRVEVSPDSVSRLGGLFYFPTLRAAELAVINGWGSTFHPRYLAEVEAHPRLAITTADANWIAELDLGDLNAFRRHAVAYWRGDAVPGREPHWENILDGSLVVCGTDLRNRARERLEREFPDCMWLLELCRLGPYLNSRIGSISAHITKTDGGYRTSFQVDMRDADEPVFLERFSAFEAAGGVVDRASLDSVKNGGEARVPDFRPYELPITLLSPRW